MMPCAAASAQTVNAAPTVATGASAAKNPVTTTSTTLSVLGADDGRESNLTYTWSVSSAPSGGDALFDDGNETNEAKDIGVAFTLAGAYRVSVTIKDVLGSSVITSVNVTVAQTLTTITVLPEDAAVLLGATQRFSAFAEDQYGNNLATQPAFTWYIDNDGPGSIDGNGVYTAPNETSESGCTVRAEGQGQAGTANVALRQRVATYVPLYAEEAPLSIQTVDLSQYQGVTRIEVTTPDPYGLHYDDFSFDDSWGHIVIDFNDLATGTVVTDQYGNAVFDGGTVSDDGSMTHGYRPPGGWTGALVVDFREPVNNLQFSTGWINTSPPEQFATVKVVQETTLLDLTVSNHNNSAQRVKAVDSAIRDLYVTENEDNALDIASLFTPMTFGCNGTGRDIHLTVKPANSSVYIVNQDLGEGNSLADVRLKVTSSMHDFVITAWLDQNRNGKIDNNEIPTKREIDVHVVRPWVIPAGQNWTATQAVAKAQVDDASLGELAQDITGYLTDAKLLKAANPGKITRGTEIDVTPLFEVLERRLRSHIVQAAKNPNLFANVEFGIKPVPPGYYIEELNEAGINSLFESYTVEHPAPWAATLKPHYCCRRMVEIIYARAIIKVLEAGDFGLGEFDQLNVAPSDIFEVTITDVPLDQLKPGDWAEFKNAPNCRDYSWQTENVIKTGQDLYFGWRIGELSHFWWRDKLREKFNKAAGWRFWEKVDVDGVPGYQGVAHFPDVPALAQQIFQMRTDARPRLAEQ